MRSSKVSEHGRGLRQMLRRLRQSEAGQGLVEYALIIVVVSLGSLVALKFLSGEVSSLFNRAGSSIASGAGASAGGGGGGGGGGTSQTISFTSTAPAGATVGGPTYTPTATATSGLTVAFTIAGAASSVCSISGGGAVSFLAAGTCIVNANQAGNGTYSAAPQVQQSFAVGAATSIPTVGTASVSIGGCGSTCSWPETATATRAGTWSANGSAITGYVFEWYARGDDNCSGSGSWGSIVERDPSSGTTTNPSATYALPFVLGDYTVQVRVYAVNGVGQSTTFVSACLEVNGFF